MKKSFICYMNKIQTLIQNIVFITSIASLIFVAFLLYTVQIEGKENTRIIDDLNNDKFIIDFIIPYVLPIAIATWNYILTVLFPQCIASILKCFISTPNLHIKNKKHKIIFIRLFNIIIFIALIPIIYDSNISISNIFTGTSFSKEHINKFTGTLAVSLFIFDRLKMYKISYLISLKEWITTNCDENPYPLLCNARTTTNDSLDSACL